MFRTDFPDLTWLRARIARGFPTAGGGWPSVVLNVRGRAEHRPDIRGPLSLFLNVRGTSGVQVAGGHRVQVDATTLFITNADQEYTLEVPAAGTETFNVHFATGLAEAALHALTTPAPRLLDAGADGSAGPELVTFANQLYQRNPALDAALARLSAERALFNHDPLRRDELLLALLPHLLARRREVLAQVARLPAARASTRAELYRRVRRAADFLHAHYATPELPLEELAGVACLSKHHFLRAFSAALGSTPFEYRRRLRLAHARQLLTDSVLPVGEIAQWVGYTSDAAFCRAFHHATGQWPLAWRLAR